MKPKAKPARLTTRRWTILRASKLRFRYARTGPWLIDGLDLSLAPGEILGLSGPSGTGKTTLAKILAGYLTPSSGHILIDGAPLPGRGYRPVQLVFQHPELTINPYFRMEKALDEPAPNALEYAERLGVRSDWLSRFPHELSGGELQRIALARALGRNTRYLIADETTAMLDAITQASLWRLLRRTVEERGIGLMAISHDAALLRRVAHRTVDFALLLATDVEDGGVALKEPRSQLEPPSSTQ